MKFKETIKQNYIKWILFAIIALVFDYIYFQHHVILHSDDLIFHLNRFVEYNNSSIFHWPYISTITFHHLGSQVNTYYPIQSVYPIILLTKLTHHFVMSVYIYLTVFNFLSLILLDYVANSVFKNRLQSFAFSILYVFSSYHMIDFFKRFDIGEYIGMILIPVAFAGMYHIAKNERGKWQLALAMTLMMYSHFLSVTMTSVVLGIAFIILMFTNSNRLQILGDSVKEAVITLGLTFWAWAPLLSHSLTNAKLVYPFEPKVMNGDNGFDQLNKIFTTDYTSFPTVGTLLFISGALAIIWVFIRKQTPHVYRWLSLLAIFALWMTSSFFPWYIFKNTSVNKIQFPSRVIIFATLLLCIIVSYAISHIGNIKLNHIFTYAVILISCIYSLFAIQQIYEAGTKEPNEIQNANITDQNYVAKATLEYYKDYMPKETDQSLDSLRAHQVKINNQIVPVNPKPGHNQISYQFNTPTPNSTVDVPVLNYSKHYQVVVNDQNVPYKHSQRGTFLTKTHAKKNNVTVKYLPTFLDSYSWVITLLFALGLTGFYTYRRKH